jgi:hypothetical protein
MVWQDALEGLDAIGARATSEILLESVKRFPEPPSRDRETRSKQLEGLRLDDLDARFYLVTEDLDELMCEYMPAHADEFLFAGTLRYARKTHKCQSWGNGIFEWVRIG